eukprot:5563079-Pleurochrysis_carterae.AAC.1
MRRRRRCDCRDDGLAVCVRKAVAFRRIGEDHGGVRRRQLHRNEAAPLLATMLCESACREESMRDGVVAAWQGCFGRGCIVRSNCYRAAVKQRDAESREFARLWV